ncbi:amino acid permease, partial [bacterium]|nr:amino acid permease [bacterium]
MNQPIISQQLSEQKSSTVEALVSRLGLFTATMLVVGSLLGSGIFKKVAPMTLALQSPKLVLWSWFFAGIMTLFGVLTYAEVAARVAQTGGLYAYLRSMYGKTVGYLFGWSCFSVIQSASIASIAFVFAEAVIRVFPQAFESHQLKSIAIGTIVLLTLINYIGVLFGAWVENIFTLIKTIGILGVAILGFIFGKSHVSPVVSDASQLVASSPSGMPLVQVMFTSMLSAFWAYDGWNNVG